MQETSQDVSMTSGEEVYFSLLSNVVFGFNISPHSLHFGPAVGAFIGYLAQSLLKLMEILPRI